MKKNYILLFCSLFAGIIKGQVCTPTIAASSSNICSGETVTLTASGATSYTWMASGENTNVIIAQPASTTIYTLFAETGACASSATIQIDVNPSPSINVSAFSNTICATSATSLTAMGGAISYSWSPSANLTDSVGQNVGAFPNTTTTYTVIGYDGTCYSSAYVTVYVIPSPTVSFTVVADPTPQVWNIYPNCTGGNQPYNFSWYWGDGSPSSNIAYPSHTYSVAGAYNIFLNITDANGCPAYYVVNANLFKTANNNEVSTMIQVNVINLTTGIQTIETNNDVSIFPNPTSEKVYINTPIATEEELFVELFDVNGKLVLNKTINSHSPIDVSSLSNGVYTLKIRTGVSSAINKKLIIVR